MLGVAIIVMGIALASPIKSILDIQMDSDHLNCSAPSDDYTQATCWIFDIFKPMVTGGIIFIGAAILAAKTYYEFK